jgi:6-pyruvoyltetrahydropterin/6-carboxytetrahydropterin synthase
MSDIQYTVRKVFKVEMAHQLAKAVTCACSDTIHGHSYRVEVFLRAKGLDDKEMIKDFGDMEEIKRYVMRWDHALVVPVTLSRTYIKMLCKYNKKIILTSKNPTAEWMAAEFLCRLRDIEPMVFKVRIHETETGYAEAEV